MSQAAEQGLGEVFIAEQARLLVVLKVRGDERGLAAVALFHQLEEDIRLLGTQIEIPDLIDQEDIEARPAPDEFARSSVGDRSVHLVEQVLGADEQPAIAVLQSLQQKSGRQSGFPDSGRPDKHYIDGLGNKLQFGQLTDLAARNARLLLEGERLQSPLLRQVSVLDA